MTDYRYFQIREQDGVLILCLSDLGADRDTAAEAGRELLEFAKRHQPNRLLVNFQAVQQLASPAVGKLLLLVKMVRAQGGRVECCGATEGFREVLGMLGRSLPFDHADKPEAQVLEILKKG